ncbi:hypoxanthine phosphoribosyltransferase, partial [Sphingobacteriales bacterium CHB3]|nr:hypoxanthine phosphoribosyltransferase [Sphingobacteriales bacterium CHB3]
MPFNKKSLKINGDRFVVMLSERRIKAKVKELARTISKDYKGTVPVFIGILNGSFIFFSDLIREVSIDCEIDFLKLSSYGDAKISSGNVRLLKDLNCQVEGRDIIIVEDIIDSGLSMEYIRDLILHQNPKSFRVVTLLYKKDAVKTQMKIDYIGFSIPKDFVIGYGLDYAQKLRHLKAI